MATVNHNDPVFAGNKENSDMIIVWENMACGDVGQAVDRLGYNDITFSIEQNSDADIDFNSEELTMQGSTLGIGWNTVSSSKGSDMVFSTFGCELVSQCPRKFRPSFSGSTGGKVTVIGIFSKSRSV